MSRNRLSNDQRKYTKHDQVAIFCIVAIFLLSGSLVASDEPRSPSNLPTWQRDGIHAALTDRPGVFAKAMDYGLAADLIVSMSADQKEQLQPTIDKLLKHDNPQLRSDAAEALRLVNVDRTENANGSMERVIPLLRDKVGSVRAGAVRVMKAIGSSSPIYVKDIVDLAVGMADDTYGPVRQEVTDLLGTIGRSHQEYKESSAALLEHMATDKFHPVRELTATHVAHLASPSEASVDGIIQLLGTLSADNVWIVRLESVKSLEHIGTQSPSKLQTVAALIDPMQSDDVWLVREQVARTIGSFGVTYPEYATSAVGQLDAMMGDTISQVTEQVVQALGAIGVEHQEVVDQTIRILARSASGSSGNSSPEAARSLGAIAVKYSAHSDELIEILNLMIIDDDNPVGPAAIDALGTIATKRTEHVDRILDIISSLLDDQRSASRRVASVEALTAIGAANSTLRDKIIALFTVLLNDSTWSPKDEVVLALGNLAAAASDDDRKVVDILVNLLSNGSSGIQVSALSALEAVAAGMHADPNELLGVVVPLLKDESPDVRQAAARWLGAVGEVGKDGVKDVVKLLGDSNLDVRLAAAATLRELGATDVDSPQDEVVLTMAQMLVENLTYRVAPGPLGGRFDTRSVRNNIIGSSGFRATLRESPEYPLGALLLQLGPHTLPLVLEMYDAYHGRHWKSPIFSDTMRFWALFLSGTGGSELGIVRCIIDWLGVEAREDSVPVCNGDALGTLLDLIGAEDRYGVLRSVVEPRLVMYAERELEKSNCGNRRVVGLIRTRVKDAGRAEYLSRIHEECGGAGTSGATWIGRGAALHVTFWLALIFVYPRSRNIQALFFWNRWMRRAFGLLYVGILLAWIPWLRMRLFAPFRDQLLGDAELELLPSEDEYDTSIEVVGREDGKRMSIEDVPAFEERVVILEGGSGTGKTWFLRRLVRESTSLAVFLNASRCKDGVIEAIQSRVAGAAGDPVYLMSIIHAGGMDVVIDGLNEVSGAMRGMVTSFAESFSRAHIVISTQPMSWERPKPARSYFVQPLEVSRVEEFLKRRVRAKRSEDGPPVRQLEEGCSEFVLKAFGGSVDATVRESNVGVLCSPMELSVVAEMLVRGQNPDLHNLMGQHYDSMAEEYARMNQRQAFPLFEFARRAYEMRCAGSMTFEEDEFQNELYAMSVYRMVVPRVLVEEGANSRPAWAFRHEKIMDYFVVMWFLHETGELAEMHVGDSRFGGVYLLLVELMDDRELRRLCDSFIDYWVSNEDDGVVREFVKRARMRVR